MYVGRFAPSPTGPLHAGSLATALASWLDARSHGGRWLVRIEDIDTHRCVPGADQLILQQLAACGLMPDTKPTWQSRHKHRYQQALEHLSARQLAYPCACSRKDIAAAQQTLGVTGVDNNPGIYPGTCRPENGGLHSKVPHAWRFHSSRYAETLASPNVAWHDRRLGMQSQDLVRDVGDFVLKRGDGLWAYQLAVVTDDGAQGITDVVRGIDLADNTPRQIALQRSLGLTTPRYLHTPLVCSHDGRKLSKQNQAPPLDVTDPYAALRQAAQHLGLHHRPTAGATVTQWLAAWVEEWRLGVCGEVPPPYSL